MMIAYKLCRQKKNGDLTSLFINKKVVILLNTWLDAEPHQTKGFAFRPGFHCTASPNAPHLSLTNRVWLKVEIDDYKEDIRPLNQGGKWFLANKIKFLKTL
jgi:hypothetical protein